MTPPSPNIVRDDAREDLGVAPASQSPLSHPFGAEPVPVSGKAGIANAGVTRPHPTPADILKATAWVDGEYRKQVDPDYFEFHRDSLIRQTADAEMMKRQTAEFHARQSAPKRRAA